MFFISHHDAVCSSCYKPFFDSNILESKNLENKQYVTSLKFMQLFSALGIFIIPMFLYSYLMTFDFKFRKVIRQKCNVDYYNYVNYNSICCNDNTT